MSFEIYKIYFFIIHLVNLIALIIHIGIKEDGFDVKLKRLTKQGKIASVLEGISVLAFCLFVAAYNDLCDLSSLYLGFGITVSIFIIPFLSTCHIKYSKQKVKLNFAGFVALLVGISGFLCSLIWFFDVNSGALVKTDMIDNYISILGQFIAGTSALIAFSGTTIESKQERNDKGKPIPVTRLTDLGKVAITVIVIGFAVSIINFNLENAEKERVNIEVDQILAQAQSISQNLDTANEFLTHNLMPTTEQWLRKLDTKVNEIEDLDQKLMAVQRDLKTVATAQGQTDLIQQVEKYRSSLGQLRKEVKSLAKATELKKLSQKIAQYQNTIGGFQQQLKTVAKSQQVTKLQESIEGYQTEIRQLRQALQNTAKSNELQSLKKEIQKLQEVLQDTTQK